METYVMGPAGGTEKYLVIIEESAYDTYGTLQRIENVVCDSYHVQVEQVSLVDLFHIDAIYFVDRDGIYKF